MTEKKAENKIKMMDVWDWVMVKDLSNLSKLFSIYDSWTNEKIPVELSESQKKIWNVILNRWPKRVHVMTTTQYGKSFTVWLAVLTRAITHPEKWAIVAPSQPKAMIIMKVILEHVFDNEVYKSQLDITAESKERLRRELSKTRITFKWGWEIFVLSADSKNKKDAGEALMWFWAPNIILDESCLIDNDIYAKIFRMLGWYKNNFILEIGNPFNRNHFLESYRNPLYHKIIVDYKQAIKEWRLQESFVEEMKWKAFFDVLYECKFPTADSVDSDWWSSLFLEDEIRMAMRDKDPDMFWDKRLWIDIAAWGWNLTVWTMRSWNYAKVVAKMETKNLMDIIAITRWLADEHNIKESNIFMDATGVGIWLYSRFKELGWDINWVNMAERANDSDKYINCRAEAYFRLREWLKKGWTLSMDNWFFQLEVIRYKLRDSGKIKIIDKETLRQRGIPSPDVADSLMMTFLRDDEWMSYQRKANIEIKRRCQPRYN